MISIMSIQESNSCKRPSKLNFDIFKNNKPREYKINEIRDDFKSLTPKIRKKNSKVTFSPSVKRYDGMCKKNKILDRHIYEISEGLGKTGIFQQMIKNKNIKDMQILYDGIINLIEKCQNSTIGNVPVIPSGRGKSGFINRSVHLEPLKKHADKVLSILNKIKAEKSKF